ncbi:MAG: hypothetical protein A2X81_17265 [Desulfobacterales bacterium GWB2_56_26]|nr:MAG: hypothetical protein A2X81_17265 [Desulfobacterales bacterium GWB2_56_26]
MSRSFLCTASLTLCWTLSPDVLVFLGNSFGRHGKTFGIVLLVGAALSAAAAYFIHHPASISGEDNRQDILAAEAGLLPAITLNLAGRLSPALLFSTGMLVTAGFTFNETFVYWFPNFGFSFLLLLLIVILHLCGEKVVLAAQQVFLVLTASCMLFLAVAGLMTGPALLQPDEPVHPTVSTFFSLVPLAMLFFLGYDQRMPGDGESNPRYFPAAVGLGFLLLILWGLASLSHVPQVRLAESSVPYVVAAKAILGQPGRLIMGIAVISGTCGAVSGLFYLAVGTVRQTYAESIARNPNHPKHHVWQPKIQAILMAFIIALFLALGLAGNENLEVFIFGALLLWLLTIGMNSLATAVHLHKQQEKKYSPLGYASGGLGVVLLAAVAHLAFTYPQPPLLVGFCVSVLAASGLFSAIWCRYGRRSNSAINNTKGDML